MAHATSTDLAAYTGKAAPDDADRLLTRASEIIDGALLTAVYVVNDSGIAVDQPVLDALRDATCAQVEFWQASDEEDDILGPVQGVSLGGLQLQYGAGDNRVSPTVLAPRAWRALRGCSWIRW